MLTFQGHLVQQPLTSRETFNYIKVVQKPIQPAPKSFQGWDICRNLHHINQTEASCKQSRHPALDTEHWPCLTFLPSSHHIPLPHIDPSCPQTLIHTTISFAHPVLTHQQGGADPVWYIFISNHIVAQRNYSLVYKSTLPPVNSSQPDCTQWSLKKRMVTITKTVLK